MNPVSLITIPSARYPEKTAVRQQGKSYSYAQLKQRCEKVAAAMAAEVGLSKSDRVILRSRNGVECIEIILAAFLLGATTELYNVRWSAEVTQLVLDQSEAKIAFVGIGEPDYAEVVVALQKKGLRVVTIGGSSPGCHSFDNFIQAAHGRCVEVCDLDADDVILQPFTSGTTNLPKGVMLSCGGLLHQLQITSAVEEWLYEDVFLGAFPFYHVAGFSFLKALLVGAEVVICNSNRIEDIAFLISKYRVTRTSFAPIMLRRLLRYEGLHRVDLSSLRTITYGSDRMPADLISECKQTLACKLLQAYGMSETTGTVTALLPRYHDNLRLLQTVGKALPGVELRIENEQGERCPTGCSGEVVIRSKALMKGYWRNEALTQRVLRDGWYHTHDIGFLDKEGFLHLRGRMDGMIVSGGENIFPRELAECLISLNGVSDVAVIGVADSYWGQGLAAFVVKEGGSSLGKSDVIEHCASHLGRFKKPRHVYFIESLPRGATGKVLEKDLLLLHERFLSEELRRE